MPTSDSAETKGSANFNSTTEHLATMTSRSALRLRFLSMLLLLLAVVGTPTKAKGGAPVFVHDAFSSHAPPAQIHLALAAAGGMTISWATAMPTRSSVVRFSLNAHNFTTEARADAPCEQYDFCAYASPWMHHVTIDGARLQPATTYYCA